MAYRIGFGVDYHQLAEERPLMIGGVHVPHSKGSLGHSDADVLLHAICDAMLGAAALGDIGTHFPDADEKYRGISSTLLLEETARIIGEKNWEVVNIDSTVCLQEPKIRPFISQMQQIISAATGIGTDDISIKATTTEKMGFVGRREGIVAYASVLLAKAGI